MTVGRPHITIVDDDESIRESLPDLLEEFGFSSEAFSSAEAFLASEAADRTECLILDVAMPGLTGPELEQELVRRGWQVPIVYITAHRDETTSERLLKRGAVTCLFKPFSDAELQSALTSALRVM